MSNHSQLVENSLHQFFIGALSNATPLNARWILTQLEGDIPLMQYQLCNRLIAHIDAIQGEDSYQIRRWLSASMIAFIWALCDGSFSPLVNANRFLVQIANYDVESTLRNEILQFGFYEVEDAQIPWYSDEGVIA
jgi:hypothetical protein